MLATSLVTIDQLQGKIFCVCVVIMSLKTAPMLFKKQKKPFDSISLSNHKWGLTDSSTMRFAIIMYRYVDNLIQIHYGDHHTSVGAVDSPVQDLSFCSDYWHVIKTMLLSLDEKCLYTEMFPLCIFSLAASTTSVMLSDSKETCQEVLEFAFLKVDSTSFYAMTSVYRSSCALLHMWRK